MDTGFAKNLELLEYENHIEKQIEGKPYTDVFLINRKEQNVQWIYYNPDAPSGGQYVIHKFDFELIKEAESSQDISSDFFDFIHDFSSQAFIDIDTACFLGIHNLFLNPDYKTMVIGGSNLDEMRADLISKTIKKESK